MCTVASHPLDGKFFSISKTCIHIAEIINTWTCSIKFIDFLYGGLCNTFNEPFIRTHISK